MVCLEVSQDQGIDAFPGGPTDLELLAHARVGHHQRVLFLLHLRHFFHHGCAQQLILQARERDGKVNQRHFDAHLRGVVRVGQFRRHEELERVVPRNDGVADFDHLCPALFEFLLQQQRLQSSVQRLANVLQQHPPAEAHAVLQRAEEVFVAELDDVDVVGAQRGVLAHILDVPAGGLVCLEVSQNQGIDAFPGGPMFLMYRLACPCGSTRGSWCAKDVRASRGRNSISRRAK